MITRSEVIKRAATMWKPGTVPYSQERIEPATGYRQDCSGFASMCWNLPRGYYGGLNTVTLATGGYMHEIDPSDLKPGDAVGICGPGSAGDDGHIVIFERWANDDPDDNYYWMYEQAGGQRGPVHRMVDYPYGGSGAAWKAWRLNTITDNEGGTVAIGDDDFLPFGRAARAAGRNIGVLVNDLWSHEMFGNPPYDAAGPKSYRQQQLDRIEAYAKAAAERSLPLVLDEQTVINLADALAMRLPHASAAEIAAALIAALGGRPS